MATSKEKAYHLPENLPRLSSGEIHLWQVSTDCTPADFAEYKTALTETELARVPFFEFEPARNSYIVSQGALRILLSRYLGISTQKLKLGRQRKGKPYSMDDSDLQFNMSNSGGMVAIAFSRDGDLGIDIEQIRSLPDLDEMISKNFSPREIKYINAKPEERLKRFFRYWTIKESYLKAIGEGMRLTPDKLEFSVEKNSIKLLSVTEIYDHEDWYFKEFKMLHNYVGTLTHSLSKAVIKQLDYNIL